MVDGNKYYPLREAAEMLNIQIRTARQWVHDGRLKAVHYPGSRRWYVTGREILRMRQDGIEDES